MNLQNDINVLVSLETAADLIRQGISLSVAGPESLLDQLPAGSWIGGTASYFMTLDGGVKATDNVFVSRLPAEGTVTFARYEVSTLHGIVSDGPEDGFSFAIIPSASPSLRRFAEEGRFWPDIFLKPVLGWVAGIDLDQLGKQTAKIYDGRDGSKHEDGAVVAHVSLPEGRLASIETVNIFERAPGEVIRFAETGFDAGDCTVNDKPTRLVDFLASRQNSDGQRPLIGDFGGASINVSIQTQDPATGRVVFYAPVFADVDYYLAQPVGDYAARFAHELEQDHGDDPAFSCGCILNYLYGGLEGKRTGSLQGPVTFGEIAYLLHNQTLVILTIQ